MSIKVVEYFIDRELVDYPFSIDFMEKKVESIHNNTSREFIWFLEHDNIYTAGTSSKASDLVEKNKFKVYESSRGGQYTYHGPGQRVIYLMLNIRKNGYDIRKFISMLEQWIIVSLSDIGLKATKDRSHVGIWVREEKSLKKISSIGLRVRKGITFHGVSLNLNPNLENFKGINPCGNNPKEMTSLKEMGLEKEIKNIDKLLINNFEKIFNSSLKPMKILK
tara:strand:- start:9816 stop:10478 length:663 start_codon:yes stop_codon:yes gene_type:complete